jgi:hypothetical protein
MMPNAVSITGGGGVACSVNDSIHNTLAQGFGEIRLIEQVHLDLTGVLASPSGTGPHRAQLDTHILLLLRCL